MDRSERTAIFEPILLILKQRTGIAMIASTVIAVTMFYFGYSVAEVTASISPLLIFIGGQKAVDAMEVSGRLAKELQDLYLAISELKDGVQKVEELELIFDEVLDVVDYLSEDESEEEEVVG